MTFNDLFAGLSFLVLAAAVAFAAYGLPNPSEQPLGPSAFPMILAGLLAVCAVLLAISGARAASCPLIGRADWSRNRGAVLRLMLVPLVVVFYMLAAEPLGFLLTAPVVLAVLFLAGGVKLPQAVALALVVTLAIHSLFYLGLGVQLPWGPLAPIRW
jgi:putative tricarboxylic transport membrane protein